MFTAKRSFVSLLFAILVTASLTASAQDKAKKPKLVYNGEPLMWRAPEDIATRNLLLGPGGIAMRPNTNKITFLEDKTGGYSKKYRVKDASGVEWVAKLGKEAQPDTAANRLIWAIGYEPEIAYLIPQLTIEGKGTFENVRLESRDKSVDRIGNWLWESNPFIGKPELQGLKVFMALINNWDLKDDNNEILVERGNVNSIRRHIISDLGGSFGKTGGFFSRTRNEPDDYVKTTSAFIKGVQGNKVNFSYSGKNQKLFSNVTVEDAKWLAGWMSRLSDEQLKDAFRAANYSPEEVNALAGAVRARVNALANLSANMAAK